MTKFFLGLWICFLCVCCSDGGGGPEPQGDRMLPESSVTFTAVGGSRKIAVQTSGSWQIQGKSDWCGINKTSGTGKDSVVISVTRNIFKEQRSCEYTVKAAEGEVAGLQINQQPAEQDFVYRMPVVFHVLYRDENNINQNIASDFLTVLLPVCNRMYREGKNGVDVGVEFFRAESDPQGNALGTPGIHRVKWTKEMGGYDYIQSKNADDVALLWDPSRYINVVIFPFLENGLAGISKMPFTVADNALKGLIAGDFYFTHPLDQVQCIALNTRYVIRPEAGETLAHELGHYLGLFHVFSNSSDLETDYCGDTPNYNREAYMGTVKQIIAEEGVNSPRLYERTGDDGGIFISRNIMDYEYTYQDEFTAEQYQRIRQVVEYSPLIPGEKKMHFLPEGKSYGQSPEGIVAD